MKVGKFIWKEGLEGPSTYDFENISPDASFIARAIFGADYCDKEQFGGSEVPLFRCQSYQMEKDGGAV